MKRSRFLTVILTFGSFMLIAVLPALANEPTDQVVTVVESGEYRVLPGNDGHKIVMEGFGYRMAPGEPMLPEKRCLIALPPGARVQRVEAHGLGGTLLPGNRRIVPAPSIVPLAGSDRSRELAIEVRREWQENYARVYSADDVYPDANARITGSGSFRKYAYAAVSVCPFSYHPLSGRLTHYDAVRVTVYFTVPAQGSDRAREVEALMRDRVAERTAPELFVNYEQVSDLYKAGTPTDEVPAATYNYVVITTEALVGAISSSNFIAWKTTLGYQVRTVLTTDPEIAGQPGGDLAEQIRNFLRSYYGLWGIEYVLIVGDYAMVPMRYCYPDPGDHTHNPGDYGNPGGSVPTDYYYADLSLSDAESWDYDGDGFHGEYLEDAPDFLADVYVGRIPTSDNTRITYTLDKLTSFEQDHGAWKDQALQPGSILFYENQDHQGYPTIDGSTLLNQIEIDLMSGWTVSRYTEQDGLDPSDFPWPAVSLSAFIDDWRTGQYGVVNWSGHGAPFGVSRTVWDWDDGDGVPETDGSDIMSRPTLIDAWCALDDDHPSIVFAVSCNVGYPEPNGVGNLGIDLLTKPEFGAAAGIVSSSRVASISADVIAHPGGAESICYEFNRYGIAQSEKLGEALYHAKHYCYQNYGWDHYLEYLNQFNFDLYGDPSMMRTGIATAVSPGPVTAGESVLLLQNHPNPFNPRTEITYVLRKNCRVRLDIVNVRGQRVVTLVDEYQRAGRKIVRWDGRSASGDELASGVYFYQLNAGGRAVTRKMVLVK